MFIIVASRLLYTQNIYWHSYSYSWSLIGFKYCTVQCTGSTGTFLTLKAFVWPPVIFLWLLQALLHSLQQSQHLSRRSKPSQALYLPVLQLKTLTTIHYLYIMSFHTLMAFVCISFNCYTRLGPHSLCNSVGLQCHCSA